MLSWSVIGELAKEDFFCYTDLMKTAVIALAIIVGAGIISLGIYFGLRREAMVVPNIPTAPVSPASRQLAPSPTVILTPSLAPTVATVTATPEITWAKSDIIAALSQKTGIAQNKIKFSLGEQIKKPGKILIRGAVNEEGSISGAGFFGYIDSQGVHITYVGQGVPECSQVNPYGYPLSWADYCVDASGQTVRRH